MEPPYGIPVLNHCHGRQHAAAAENVTPHGRRHPGENDDVHAHYFYRYFYQFFIGPGFILACEQHSFDCSAILYPEEIRVITEVLMSALEFEAKNVDKAVEKACDELNMPKEKLKHEVLSYGSSGIFGLFGTKKAKIRLPYRNFPEPLQEEDSDSKKHRDASSRSSHRWL